MEHKINSISGYYEGPDGVFYDFKRDIIFALKFYGTVVYNAKLDKVVGKYYKLYIEHDVHSPVAVIMKDVIRLGDL